MILGDVREPYLAAALESAADFCDWAVININGDEEEEGVKRNLQDVIECRMNKEDHLTILGLPFRNYSFARNICLEASRDCDWILRLDGDEVLWRDLNLLEYIDRADAEGCNRVVGNFWHFLKSWEHVHNESRTDRKFEIPFLFKMSPDLSWSGVTHERIAGPAFSDLVTGKPVWCHFGYVDPVKVFDKWLRFANVEGDTQSYLGYFADPQATWRKGPANILDDREQYPYTDILPQALTESFSLDPDTFKVHASDCLLVIQEKGECTCNHDL